MPSSYLIRLSGLAAVSGGVLFLLAEVLSLLVVDFENFSAAATTGSYFFTSLLFLLGGVLLLAGLVGLYAYQSEATGVLGLAAFLVAFLGTALAVGAFWTQLFVVPSAALEAPAFVDAEQVAGPLDAGFTLTFALVAVGWALFGLSSLRARIYPRVAAIVLIVGAVITFLPLPLTTLALDVAVVWLGFIVLTGRGETVQQPSRVN